MQVRLGGPGGVERRRHADLPEELRHRSLPVRLVTLSPPLTFDPMTTSRIERDPLGEKPVPDSAL